MIFYHTFNINSTLLRYTSLLFVLSIIVVLNPQLSDAQVPVKILDNGTILIDDFSQDMVGSMPSKWYVRDGNVRLIDLSADKKAKYRYRVVEENGRKYLRYSGKDAMHIGLPIYETSEIDLQTHPILSWEWRVHAVPTGANEDIEKLNDTAASIYVVYEISSILRIPKVIRYTWSSTLPKSTYLSKGRQKILVKETGTDRKGEWIRFERDIAQDYRNFFGEEPPKRPLAILILSDANNTGSFAFADYGPIYLKRSPTIMSGSK
jgi:hypothetical protein